MDVSDLLGRIGDRLTVERAFGPPYEHDGALVIPVALVIGGGGGGNPPGELGLEGGGFGGVIHPLGAYVAQQGKVRFVPSVDGTVVIVAALGLLRVLLTRRREKT